MPCQTPCDACKPGELPILFTRYAVAFSADAARRAALQKLKPAAPFMAPPVPLTTGAGYAVRMLREGVLYVLIESAGHRQWDGYLVHSHGYLSCFDPQATPVPAAPAQPACEMDIRGANKSLVWVANPAKVTRLWYFFSPDPVLADMLNKLKADPAQLHQLDVAAWVVSCPATAHASPPDRLTTQVGEWAALTDPQVLDGLNEQIYAVMGISVQEQHYGSGRVALYVNTIRQTRVDPPADQIFSDENPRGLWRITERTGAAQFPAYAQVHGKRLANIAQTLAGEPGNPKRPPGIVAACDDAIGIAQELNHWRNKAYKDLIDWGDAVEDAPTPQAKGNKQSRKTRFEIANAWAKMAPLFRQKRIAMNLRIRALGAGVSDRPVIWAEMTEAQQRAPVPQGRVFATRAEYEKWQADLEKATEAQVGPVADKRWAGYMEALDLVEMNRVRTDHAKAALTHEKLAASRAPDALAWIDSTALQDALALYNGQGRDDTVQGIKFAAQINGILEGFGGGGERCVNRLMAWAQDYRDNPKNLLWRGYLMNQRAAQSSFDAAMKAAAVPGKTADQLAEVFKTQLDKFAKFNDVMDGPYSNLIRVSQAIPLFGMSAALNAIFHAVLKAGVGTIGFENTLARALMNSVAFGTGSAGAFQLYVEQQAALRNLTRTQLLNQKGYGLSQARAKFRQTTQGAVNRVIAQGGQGEFFKMRLTGGLVMLESVLFMFKAKELGNASGEEAARAAWEFAAASATTAAAALEIGGVVQEWLFRQSSSPAAKAMAEIRLGGFKLAGGALGMLAGLAAAYLDFQAAGKASQEEKTALIWLFRARSGTNFLAAGTSGALGFSYAGPLLEHWAKRMGGNIVLEGLAVGAEWLFIRQAALFAGTWIMFFAVTAITFVIAFLDDDAVQKWVKRSSFRKLPGADPKTSGATVPTPAVAAGGVKPAAKENPKPKPLYEKPGEELVELFNGFVGVTS